MVSISPEASLTSLDAKWTPEINASELELVHETSIGVKIKQTEGEITAVWAAGDEKSRHSLMSAKFGQKLWLVPDTRLQLDDADPLTRAWIVEETRMADEEEKGKENVEIRVLSIGLEELEKDEAAAKGL